MEEDLGYELGQITSEAKMLQIQIIDLDQLPNEARMARRRMPLRGPEHGVRRIAPGFFNWTIHKNPFDLSRYQIYQDYNDINPELCFIHALREKGINELLLSNISKDLNGIERVTLQTLEFIACKYSIFIRVRAVYPDKFYYKYYPREYKYDDSKPWIDLCFFTVQDTDYPEHIIPYDTDIKFNINYFKCNKGLSPGKADEQRIILNKYSVDQLMKFSRFGQIDEGLDWTDIS